MKGNVEMVYGVLVTLIICVDRSRRGRKDLGIVGQASWTSSVINLLNTSA